MVGAALPDCWKRAGSPADAVYVELGPGRGTLAADALRVLSSAGFAGEVHFVETSPVLRQAQAQAVPDAKWHETIDTLPASPMLLVANEFLDALPIQQFVHGIERRIGLLAGGLAFERDGEIVEISPLREQVVRDVAARLKGNGGVALFIDYGHARSGRGDTLQAVRGHRFSPVLADPGEQDLTSHVDFEAVQRTARDAGASVTPIIPQGEWLKRLGVERRAQALARSNPDRSEDVEQALNRLTAADQMGELFKVVAVHAPEWPIPVGFA